MVAGPRLDQPVPPPPSPPGGQGSRRQRGSAAGPVVIGLGVGVVVLLLVLAAAWLTGGLAYAGWWLTNATPPAVALSGPTAVVRGPVQVAVQLPPRSRVVGAQA